MARLVRFGRFAINLDHVRDVRDLDGVGLTAEELAQVRNYLDRLARPWRPRVIWPPDDEDDDEAQPRGVEVIG